MAVVITLGEKRNSIIKAKKISRWENWLVQPFLQAEKHRVEMSRAKHPGDVNDNVIKSLAVGAAVYTGVIMYWFVKYIIIY